MKRTIYIIALLILSSLSLQAETLKRGAIIEMDSTSHDFGRVSRRGADLTHTFTLRNVGDQALIITDATTTCTCLKVKHPRRPIAPNAEAKVEVRYELQRKEVGAFHKVIKLTTNSVSGEILLLTIHGFSILQD